MSYIPSLNLLELKRLEKKLSNGKDFSEHFLGEEKALQRLHELEKLLQQKERESSALNAALNEAFRGVARVSPDGRYIYLNKAYADMLEATPEELLGTEISWTIHPEDMPIVLEALERVKKGGKGEACIRGVTSKGRDFKKLVIMVPDRETGGNWCFMNNVDGIQGLNG